MAEFISIFRNLLVRFAVVIPAGSVALVIFGKMSFWDALWAAVIMTIIGTIVASLSEWMKTRRR